MEGPIGVMKQLEALGRILELTDLQLFKHLDSMCRVLYLSYIMRGVVNQYIVQI